MKTIIVPVDGATNIKLEALDFDSLATVYSRVSTTPVTEVDGLAYNRTGDECSWFDDAVSGLPADMRTVEAIAPVARGASGGLVGSDNTLIEVPGESLTLSYTQTYPARIEDRFRELAGNDRAFFLETGSVREFPGSITLLKRFVYEEMERPGLVERAACFGTYNVLLAGHFMGNDYLRASRAAGNEHGYWMCHTGARNINEPPGTPSAVSAQIPSFVSLVSREPGVCYRAIGRMPPTQAEDLGIGGGLRVLPGGHDTCLSHIPVMSTFYQAFREREGTPVIHVEAGSWTVIARIGGRADLPADGYRRDIVVQGTVDGDPVVTARYGGGNDFKHVKQLVEERCGCFGGDVDERDVAETADASDCFVLPNIHPMNRLTGPFPRVDGRIVHEAVFFADPLRAYVVANLTTSLTAACQIETMAGDRGIPLVITAGGSKDPLYGRLLATLTGKTVYAMFDRNNRVITETTTLGAAIAGKAACLGIHPYQVEMRELGVTYRELPPFSDETARKLTRYRQRFLKEIARAGET